MFRAQSSALIGNRAGPRRHCGCVFKDIKNVDRLNSLIRGLLITSVVLLKHIIRTISGEDSALIAKSSVGDNKKLLLRRPKIREEKVIVDESVDSEYSDQSDEASSDERDDDDEDMDVDADVSRWPLEDKEKLFHMVSKVFYMHFPMYTVHKNSLHQTRLDDLTQREAALLSSYCDLNDPEVSILLLRNISFYCEQDIMDLFVTLFAKSTPSTLPLTFAHAVIAVIHHLKYGLNVNNMLAKLVSLRTCVINYLCNVSSVLSCADRRLTLNAHSIRFLRKI